MKFYIITYGCQMNVYDSQRISEYLEKDKGYQKAGSPKGADLIVVNVCSVRQRVIDRVREKINKFQDKHIVLTGCILKKDRKEFEKMGVKFNDFSDLKKTEKFRCSKQGYVPIMRGCSNFCSYCAVPYTRGRERCRKKEDIIKEVKGLLEKGIREITLLGQNVNSYKIKMQNAKIKMKIQNAKRNKPKIFTFVDLLKEVTALPGDFKIRFLTNHPKDFTEELIDEVAQNPKLKKYIHLPVQSGDNEILKKMNRPYTREQYLELVKKIRKKIPDVELTTDVIVGFPGETKQQFQNTVDLFKQCQFDQAYIAKYSPRPGTAAAKLKDDVSPQEKKRREKVLRDLLSPMQEHYSKHSS